MAHTPRPTLPPLHSLGLPRERAQVPHSDHPRVEPSFPRQAAQPSPSSQPCELPVSSPSPPACLRPCTNAPAPTSTSATPLKIRLVRTSFENADAVLLVPPPPSPNTPPPQPLLLVGPALRRRRQLAKGTRVHPYRIIRDPSNRRPSSSPADTKA